MIPQVGSVKFLLVQYVQNRGIFNVVVHTRRLYVVLCLFSADEYVMI